MTEFRARISRVRMKGGADVTIIEPRSNDVPAMARKFAHDVECGEYGSVDCVVAVVATSDDLHLFGWGNIDGLRATGLLSMGSYKLNEAVVAGLRA